MKPKPGDAVQIIGQPHSWTLTHENQFGIIDGHGYEMWPGCCYVCFRAQAYRSADGKTVACSGGPVPFVYLAALIPAGTISARFWKWNQYGPGAGNGEDYTLEVPLWHLPAEHLNDHTRFDVVSIEDAKEVQW
jgi:hypothetical protein